MTHPEAAEITKDEGLGMLERISRQTLGLSWPEFLRAWEAGEYDANPDRPEIMRLVMLMPLGR